MRTRCRRAGRAREQPGQQRGAQVARRGACRSGCGAKRPSALTPRTAARPAISASRGAVRSRSEKSSSTSAASRCRRPGSSKRKPRLGRRVVDARALVDEVGDLAEHAEAVREADGDPQLVMGLVVEHGALPLAEGGRAAAQVDDDVEDLARGRSARACPARGGSGSASRAGCRGASASGCPARSRSDAVLAPTLRRGRSRRRSRARRLDTRGASSARPSSPCLEAAASGRRLGGLGDAPVETAHEPCRGPPPMPPAAPRPPDALRVHLRRASTSSRARRRTSRSTSSTTSTRPPSTRPRSSRAAPTPPRSTVVRFSQALGFEGFPELQEAAREEYRHVHRRVERPAGVEPAAPLFSLDQTRSRQAVAADHVNVEETARQRRRARRSRRAIEAIAAAERILIAGTDQMAFFASYLRHLLMLLDVRAEIVASPSQEALARLGAHRRGHARDRAVGRPPASARRAGDEDRPPPQRADARDRRRDALRGRQARASAPLLLVEPPAFVRSHTALLSHPAGARLRRLRARRRRSTTTASRRSDSSRSPAGRAR